MKYLNSLIKDSHHLFNMVINWVITAGLVTLIVVVYGCSKKQEPGGEQESNAPIESVVQESTKEESLPEKSVSLEDELFKQTKIAFVSYRKEDAPPGTPAYLQEAWFEFYVMNTDGSQQKRITSNRLNSPVHLFWSPDGRWIAFWQHGLGKRGIYIVNTDGSVQQRLTDNPDRDQFPCWSPDGKKIAFVRYYGADIYVMNRDGSEQKNLTPTTRSAEFPCWSPNGEKIAFVSNRDGNKEIYIMNPDGSEQQNLTKNPAPDMCPSWSPFLAIENTTIEKK